MPLFRTIIQQSIALGDHLDKYLSPVLFLGLRIWVGMIFFRSGLQKLEDWDNTLDLFQYEYAIPFLPHSFAAYSATFFELIAAPLLMVGFLTRLSAFPLLGMTIVIQLTYLQHEHHYAWGTVLLLIILKGPGALSLDQLVQCWSSKKKSRA
tara:strand:+ start:1815 stop:2267 length:453 start_codon:yes stop_codon:yes gene_type:complete